jgi:RNA polymerase sigma-70 factor (ECF subfamily)
MTAVAESLLAQVAVGDAEAVREVISRYGPLVWSLARRLSATAAEAEDGVQDVFVDLWRSAPRFDPSVASEVAFVAMIARRRLIDRRRRAGRLKNTEPLAEEAAPTTVRFRGSESLEACGEAVLARRVLDELRPEQREVLVMAACHGMSHQEIADALGMPLGTVKAHARRGLLQVRRALLGDDATVEAAPRSTEVIA